MKNLYPFYLALLLISAPMPSWGECMGTIIHDPLPKGCQILRDGEMLGCDTRLLYFGDRLHPGIPIDEFERDLSDFVVLIEDEMGGFIVQDVKDALNQGSVQRFAENFLGRERLYRATTAVRGTAAESPDAFIKAIKVTPPAVATVLPNIPIVFRWHKGEGEELVIEDLMMKTVFSQELAETGSYEITPEEAGLKPGQQYTWYYRGDVMEERYSLNLLDLSNTPNPTVSAMLQELPEINSVDDAIYTATYLQLVSDLNKETDFYWLSFQVLPRSFESMSSPQKTKVLNLFYRYYDQTKQMN